MTTKKFLSLAFASTLALSMAAPAFASEDGTGSLSFEYTGETWTEDNVVIDVSMPTATSGNIVLNPYKLEYVGTKADGSTEVQSYPVVTGKLNYVENNSNFPVDVAWEITGTAGGGVNFVEKAPAATATTKDVYLPIVLNKTSAKGTAPTTNVDTKLKAVKAEAQTSTEKTVVTMDKVKGTNAVMCFGIAPYEAESDGSYKSGATLNNGDKLTEKWTEEDTVGVSMVFSFSKHVE